LTFLGICKITKCTICLTCLQCFHSTFLNLSAKL
jgi:hypothetical protein